MSREMWRFDCEEPGVPFDVRMPRGAVVRHVGTKDGRRPAFWAEVDPTAPVEPRTFAVLATGDAYPDATVYHGTVVTTQGLVWHLLEPSR